MRLRDLEKNSKEFVEKMQETKKALGILEHQMNEVVMKMEEVAQQKKIL